MDAPLLQIKQVSKHFGGFTALSGVSLDIARGERFGLIGPNGSGKTTLINCISGSLRNESGSIRFENSEISGLAAYQRTRLGIARSFQIPRPFHSMSVLENLLVPSAYVAHLREAEAEAKAMEILSSIGLADKAGVLASQLSQVELRKLELARAMAAKPRLLISDEAMAGLAGAEVDEVLKILFDLNEKGITIIMIEHIMQAVMRFSQRVVCLDAGKIICEGTPTAIVGNPEVQKAYLGACAEHRRRRGRLRRGEGPARRFAFGEERRDGRAAWHQRQWQEHADEMRDGDGAAHTGHGFAFAGRANA